MEELQVFNFNGNEVRTTLINNVPMLCLKDVCKALEIKNERDCKTRLNPKGVVIADTLTNGGVQKATFINEQNFYKVVFQSRKKEAEQFVDWVTGEVLPSIRKNGGYIVNQEKMDDEELLAQSVLVAQRIIENKNKQIAEQQKQIEQMQKKVNYADVILNCRTTIDVTTIAQDYGMSAYAFNLKLKELGIQHKVGKMWIINREYLDGGYVKSETIEIPHTCPTKVKTYTKWTQRGRSFLYEKLKENELLPLIEREAN